jgi:hypothetical protein
MSYITKNNNRFAIICNIYQSENDIKGGIFTWRNNLNKKEILGAEI